MPEGKPVSTAEKERMRREREAASRPSSTAGEGKRASTAGKERMRREREAAASRPSAAPRPAPRPSSKPAPTAEKKPWEGAGGYAEGSKEHLAYRWADRKAQGWSPEDFLKQYNTRYKSAYAIADLGGDDSARLQADYDQQKAFLDEELALLEKERAQMEEEYERQKKYLEQDAALSEQERALALQELETQLKYQHEQLELRRQQAQSELTEEKRQAPLRLRDIADQFASQGAFFSGRRGEAQAEASHASDLAIQGLERQLRSEEMTVEEADALAAIKRGQFGLESQRQALEMENRLGSLRAEIEQKKLRGDLDYREEAYRLKKTLEDEKRKLTEALYADLNGGAEGKSLTKDDLGTMLRQGLISKNQYYKGMTAQGYNKDQAKALYLSEMKKGPYGASGGATGTKLSVSQLGTMLRQGLIDKNTYQKALTGKGYTPTEAKAMYASEKAKGAYGAGGKTITKSDIADAIKEGLMTPDTGYKNLRALGYDDYSARVIVAGAQKDKYDSELSASKKAKGKSLSPAQILSMSKSGVYTKTQAMNALIDYGYSPKDAAALLANKEATGSSGNKDLTGKEKTMVGESLISPTRVNERGSGDFIRKYWNDFTSDFNNVSEYAMTHESPSLAGYVSWYTKFLMSKAGGSMKIDQARARIAQYSKVLSFAWYFYFYGGGLAGANRLRDPTRY